MILSGIADDVQQYSLSYYLNRLISSFDDFSSWGLCSVRKFFVLSIFFCIFFDAFLKVFLLELERCKLDLSACREACQCTSDELALLSADRNAGWELVDSLLCPREMRMSVVDVVAHRFLN